MDALSTVQRPVIEGKCVCRQCAPEIAVQARDGEKQAGNRGSNSSRRSRTLRNKDNFINRTGNNFLSVRLSVVLPRCGSAGSSPALPVGRPLAVRRSSLPGCRKESKAFQYFSARRT